VRLRGLHKDPGFAIAFLDAGAAKLYKPRVSDMRFITCDKVRGAGAERTVTIADYHNLTKESKITHLLLVDDLVQSGSTLGVGCAALAAVFPDAIMSAWVTHPVFPNDSHVHFLPGGKFGRQVDKVTGKVTQRGFRDFFACDTVPEVADKLRKVGAPFHVIDTTPMNVQCYLEQYGLTKDLRAAVFYAPETIGVCSGNKDKVESVRRAFYMHFPQKLINDLMLVPLDTKSGVSEQPVGKDEIESGCENRLRAGFEQLWAAYARACSGTGTLPALPTYLVAMERGVLLAHGTKHEWRDQTCVKVAKPSKNGRSLETIATVWSRALAIEREYVEAALASSCTQTAGSFKAAKEGCSSSDWYAHMHGVSGIDLMQEAIQAGIAAIQAQEAVALGAI
jgi:hypothetical protein